MSERVGTNVGLCGLCDARPRWRLERRGDAIVTWACPEHLVLLLIDLLPVDKHRDEAVLTDLANVWQPRRA